MRPLLIHPFKYLLALSLFLICIKAQASTFHNGSIEGLVFESNTRSTLAGAIIRLMPSNKVSYSNNLGYFAFTELPAGSYTLTVAFIGFKTDTLEQTIVIDGATTPLKIFLEADQIDLPAIEVHADPVRNLNIISALDLRTRPIANGQEILRLVPGLFIAQHAGGGKAEQLFLRGFDIDHGTDINISVDGMPVNMVSHAHGQGYADLHFVIPELVQRIDFRKGPYYASLGNFTTAGAVQLETVNTLNESFLKLEGGNFDNYRMLTAFNLLDKNENNTRHRAFAAAEWNYSNGYFDAPQHFNRVNFLAKYNLVSNDQQSLTLSFSSFSSSWDASGQIPERAVESGLIGRFGAIDPTEGGITSRTNAQLQFFKNLGAHTFTRHQLYYTDYQFELYSNFTFFARDQQNGDQIRQREGRKLLGYNGTVQHFSQIGGIRLETEAGAALRVDRTRDSELSYTKDRSITLEQVSLGHINEWNAALYSQSTAWLSPSLSIQAGLRFDQFVFGYDDLLVEAYQPLVVYKNRLSPKLNIQYQLSQKWQLFAQSGIGLHSNDTRVVTAQSGRQILPRAYGMEAGFIGKPGSRAIVQLAFWRLNLDQEFIYVGDEGIVEPGGKTRRLGVDFSGRLQLARWLLADLDINYAFARGLMANGDDELIPLAPVLTSSGGLRADFANGFGGSLRYRYLADRPANADGSLTATGFFLVDATAQFRYKKIELGIQAQNLLNEAWKEAQFETSSRLPGEPQEITEIHYTPGSPSAIRAFLSWYF